jgi:hypothetical protein
MKTNILFVTIIISLLISSCKSKEQELTEELSVMKIMQDMDGPIKISNELTMDSIGIEVSPKPFKFISYINISEQETDFINSDFFSKLIANYRNNVIKEIKDTKNYDLFKKNNTTLEYNIFVNKKFASKFIVNSNEY